MTDKPHIIEIKQIWEQTAKLDDKREEDYDNLDAELLKLFWNPMHTTEYIDYEKFRVFLTNFFNSLHDIESKYKEISRLLVQHYPEVFINGPE